MSATERRAGRAAGHDVELIVLWSVLASVPTAAGLITAAVHLGARLDDDRQRLPANPAELLIELARGTVTWPSSATLVGAGLVLIVALLGGATALAVRATRRGHRGVDRAAARMGRGRALEALARKGATDTAKRLGVQAPGLPLGRTVAGRRMLYSSWEDVTVDVWGPRTGKTTSRAIPALLAAPGAVLATSNKRDLVDATREPRAAAGPVWVFDPQGIVDEPADWWWNPLSYVTDEVKASVMADVFASASRDPTARTDAYFEPAAQDLLAHLLLAAAAGGRAITQVYLWVADPTDDEPVALLRQHHYELQAAALQGVINAPEKQRGGVYGTAQQIASFLTNRQAMRWVTPDEPGWKRRRQLDPAAFVRSGGTLYSLSKEGRGSAGPLVTALTVAITEAAEELAKRSPGGRLEVPMVAVLDEAANVCRWRELPNLYSHYGSRGICMMTILQSWSQGVEVWGRDGMRKLWSAANVKVYGGGVSEVEFLSELSQLIGDYELDTTSFSHGRGGRSTSRATRRDRVLDVSDLGALPRGRAVVFASGAPPTLLATIPWMAGPQADAVRASIQAHDPAAAQTIASTRDAFGDQPDVVAT